MKQYSQISVHAEDHTFNPAGRSKPSDCLSALRPLVLFWGQSREGCAGHSGCIASGPCLTVQTPEPQMWSENQQHQALPHWSLHFDETPSPG